MVAPAANAAVQALRVHVDVHAVLDRLRLGDGVDPGHGLPGVVIAATRSRRGAGLASGRAGGPRIGRPLGVDGIDAQVLVRARVALPACWHTASSWRQPVRSNLRACPYGDSPPQQAPPVQRLRIRYAKRGRLRFTSHRDFSRAFERAVFRARVPMAYSSGFNPHPRISYAGAAPTGSASEAEYLEIALAEVVDPAASHAALDEAMPDGLDVLEVVESPGGAAGRPARGQPLADRPRRPARRGGGGGGGVPRRRRRCSWSG